MKFTATTENKEREFVSEQTKFYGQFTPFFTEVTTEQNWILLPLANENKKEKNITLPNVNFVITKLFYWGYWWFFILSVTL